MTGWQTLWTWALGISVVLFFVVEIVVVIGGAGDIKDMMRSLRAQADKREAEAECGEQDR